jgi:hypothetical protein
MGETTETTATEATAQTPAPAPAPTAPAEPPAAEKNPDGWSISKEAFDQRVASARQAAVNDALKQAGFESLDAAKAAGEAAKAAADASKTVEDKLADLGAQAEAGQRAKGALARYAQTEMSRLSEGQRNAVTAAVGDDPEKQLTTIEALRPTWAASATAATDTTAATAPAPVQQTTAPQGSPPPEASPAQTPSPAAVRESMRNPESTTFNPFKAASFSLANARTAYGE